ncbi:hypothetical protein PMAYCL1PPCAC_21190, partial [Pristionchus mayeri]
IDGEANHGGGKTSNNSSLIHEVSASMAREKQNQSHLIDFDSTLPRQPWGKPASPLLREDKPLAASAASADGASSIPSSFHPAMPLNQPRTSSGNISIAPTTAAAAAAIAPHSPESLAKSSPSLILSQAGSLKCSGNGK